jgi:carbonic anhydrase
MAGLKSTFLRFKQNWRNDLFAGFVVSLVALPLCLGLALASNAPAIAGVITAVGGGILVALLGGSHVTITGPGNGLVVATLASIELLGQGNDALGWHYTSAAIVVSGAVILLLGILKFGALSDFFPSTAVEGMLGAIGLIIMARQIHIMLGVQPQMTDTVGYLELLPQTIDSVLSSSSHTLVFIGLGSLLIMAVYPFLRFRIIHAIPAPMWVVLLVVGFSYYQDYVGNAGWLAQEMAINIPQNIAAEYVFPNFGKVFSTAFFEAVLLLTLIASIETLLSIKGIERLDVQKRKAKVNKDLRAHGLATVVSGMLGGLNVVTVIARSSVNVNNGARTRMSNFFHAMIIAAVIFLFRDVISRIPLPALAAILVYTGYKLISPKNIWNLANLSWESMVIYVLTFSATIFTNLITGIAIGIGLTFLLQLITTNRASLILRNLFNPNTLLYTERDGTYILSVKRYANFINYIGIKKQLDTIPFGSNVVVDLTLCEFVDNSVMEHLQGYHEFHEQKGGQVEIIGLDDLQAKSNHPFAPWVPVIGKQKIKVLTKRQQQLKLFAREKGHFYSPKPATKLVVFYAFHYFKGLRLDGLRNELRVLQDDFEVNLFDLDYHRGELITRESMHSTLAYIKLSFDLPEFWLREEELAERIAALAGFKDINFEDHPDFSKRFYLKGTNPQAVRGYFKPELMAFLVAHRSYHIETNKNQLLILDKQRFSSLSEIRAMLDFSLELVNKIQNIHRQSKTGSGGYNNVQSRFNG